MSCLTPEEIDSFRLLRNFLESRSVSYLENFDLSKICHMKAGGKCKIYISPSNRSQLEAVVQNLIGQGLKYILVGRLSNTLFRTGVIKTVVISTSKVNDFYFDDSGALHIDCGVNLPKIAKTLTEQGYRGFGGLTGFPASTGGAIYMNASCYGNAISDFLVSIRCLSSAGNVDIISKTEAEFDWRYSKFHDYLNGHVIVSAKFAPKKGDAAVEKDHLMATQKNRINYQERKYPNLGSTFATVDIYGDIAKKNRLYRVFYLMIKLFSKCSGSRRDKVWAYSANKFTQFYFGLKERNGVGFSDKTMNCVVNKSSAKADDIIEFVYDVQKKIGNSVDIEIEIYDKIY